MLHALVSITLFLHATLTHSPLKLMLTAFTQKPQVCSRFEADTLLRQLSIHIFSDDSDQLTYSLTTVISSHIICVHLGYELSCETKSDSESNPAFQNSADQFSALFSKCISVFLCLHIRRQRNSVQCSLLKMRLSVLASSNSKTAQCTSELPREDAAPCSRSKTPLAFPGQCA